MLTTIIVMIVALAIGLAYLGLVLLLRSRGERDVALEQEGIRAREAAAVLAYDPDGDRRVRGTTTARPRDLAPRSRPDRP